MTAIITLAAFVAVALIGWAVAEGKTRMCQYHADNAEQEALTRYQHAGDYRELSISDVIRTISTKGFKTT